jgi:peptide/nickel transport system substrate-binding protein/oligopeptide transport system substrate-binding protein
MHTKLLRNLALWVCLTVVLVACGSDKPPEPEDIPRGGEIRWSIEGVSDLANLDPSRADEQQSIIVMELIFGGLVRLDENLRVQPDGAEDWDVSSDGKTYTFYIRNNLKFGDGTPVTAHDFVYSINRSLHPETGSYAAPVLFKHIVGATEVMEGDAETISGVQALDDHTLQIELDAPIAYFLSLLSSPSMLVVPQSLIEQEGATWTSKAVGTGPFRVQEWRRGEEIVLEANEHYWRGMPGVDTIRMPFFQDSEQAYQLYQEGELDITGNRQTGIPASRVAEVKDTPDFRTSPALAVRYLGFNNKRPPFDNVYVRQAFAMSVDKLHLAQDVLSGSVEPTSRILPDGLAGSHLSVQGQTFDPQGARAALKLAGYLSGQDLPPVTLTYGEEGDNALVAQTLQRFWRETLGIDVTLEGLHLQDFSDRLDETYYEPENGLLMYFSIWGADYPDPHNFLSQQLRSSIPNNNGHWANEQFDQLVDQADRMGEYEEADRRFQLYNEAEQIALDEVGWIPLYNPTINVLMRPAIQGLVFTPQGIIAPDWSKVRVAR